ncbi:MAG: hypothetical protein JO211_15860 [Acidobacteriaceae bacterium]|nr:hypothetical protein [Acidobacteriaceae bacterium]
MRAAYRAILRLYPAQHRSLFAEEMIETYEHAEQDWRTRGFLAFIYFAAWELAGLLGGLYTEWLAKWADPRGYLRWQSPSALDPGFPAEIVHVRKELQRLIASMEFAIAHHDFPNARLYSNQERIARERLHSLLSKYELGEQTA